VLTPGWLRACAEGLDVVHVHFGFEHLTSAELRAVVATLHQLDRPLVLTLHDLACPHLADQTSYDAALDVLVPAAAAVVTLTSGAAAEIRRRWGRRAIVLPHPHVAPLDRIRAPRPHSLGLAVGLHAKHRANNNPDAVRGELADAVLGLGGRLSPDPDRRLSDDELWDHLTGLDVLVLAYRFGTHSGFVEACHDLGTTVVAPRVGYLAEQQSVISYDLGVAGSLTAALRQAYDGLPGPRADADERAAQREELARAHATLYRAVAA
jgi:hypothetical protein